MQKDRRARFLGKPQGQASSPVEHLGRDQCHQARIAVARSRPGGKQFGDSVRDRRKGQVGLSLAVEGREELGEIAERGVGPGDQKGSPRLDFLHQQRTHRWICPEDCRDVGC